MRQHAHRMVTTDILYGSPGAEARPVRSVVIWLVASRLHSVQCHNSRKAKSTGSHNINTCSLASAIVRSRSIIGKDRPSAQLF